MFLITIKENAKKSKNQVFLVDTIDPLEVYGLVNKELESDEYKEINKKALRICTRCHSYGHVDRNEQFKGICNR